MLSFITIFFIFSSKYKLLIKKNIYSFAKLIIISLLLIKCNQKSVTKYENQINNNEIEKLEEINVFKELNLDKADKENLKNLLYLGKDSHKIFTQFQENSLLYKQTEAGTKLSDNKNSNIKNNLKQNIFKKWINKIRVNTKNNFVAGKKKSKYKKRSRKLINKFNKQYKGASIVIFALTSGIILALSLLSIISGGIFLIFISMMAGLASFRLFRKIKEEYLYCKKHYMKQKKNKKKEVKKLTKKEKKQQKRAKKIELGFFITLAFSVAIILALSLIGFIGIIFSAIVIAVLAGLGALRRVKLLFEGRL
ncbi:MAG: hypothetical protein GY830_01655 [Bacteroidetes bacterium]|nr:hypothetical protein [Bacteroidota bacterium]